MKKKWLVAAAVAGLVGTGVGFASASVPDAGGRIDGCVNNKTQVLRIIDTEAGKSCAKGETPLVWPVKGFTYGTVAEAEVGGTQSGFATLTSHCPSPGWRAISRGLNLGPIDPQSADEIFVYNDTPGEFGISGNPATWIAEIQYSGAQRTVSMVALCAPIAMMVPGFLG